MVLGEETEKAMEMDMNKEIMNGNMQLGKKYSKKLKIEIK